MRASVASLFATLGVIFVAGCQSTADDVGAVQLAIAAGPADAACLRVTVTGPGGATAVRTLGLTPGTATTGTLSGLPLGSVTVKAEAFGVACAAVTSSSTPNWLADPVSVVLTGGTPVPVQLVMQPAGQIKVSVDWNTSGAGGGPGGMGGGGAGSGGGGSTGGGGAGGGMMGVADALNGQMLLAPCLRDTEASVCATVMAACPNQSTPDLPLRGVLLTDRTLTLGGTPGTSYTITLHVQGEVEAKQYTGAIDQSGTGLSPVADGFAINGTPTTSNAYGVYMLRVTNPGATSNSDYFLNSLIPPGVSNHTTYGVDYMATISAQGGATVRLVASDANCSMIKNCGPTPSDGSTCAAPIVLTNVDPVAQALNPSFNFNTAYNGQWLSIVATNVTSP